MPATGSMAPAGPPDSSFPPHHNSPLLLIMTLSTLDSWPILPYLVLGLWNSYYHHVLFRTPDCSSLTFGYPCFSSPRAWLGTSFSLSHTITMPGSPSSNHLGFSYLHPSDNCFPASFLKSSFSQGLLSLPQSPPFPLALSPEATPRLFLKSISVIPSA